MLLFAITMVVFALVLYTVSIWAYVIVRRLHSMTVAVFGIGFVCDVAGTMAIYSLAEGPSWSLHGIIGWCAMMLMLGLFLGLIFAYHEQGWTEYRVRYFAVCAWALWVLSFLSALW